MSKNGSGPAIAKNTDLGNVLLSDPVGESRYGLYWDDSDSEEVITSGRKPRYRIRDSPRLAL